MFLFTARGTFNRLEEHNPRKLVEAKHHARLPQLRADQVPARVGDVRVLEAEDQRDLAPEPGEVVDGVGAAGGGRGGRVGGLVGAQGAAVDVCCEVADRGGDAGVELCGVGLWVSLKGDGERGEDIQRRAARGGRPDTCPLRRFGLCMWGGPGGSLLSCASPRRRTRGSVATLSGRPISPGSR